MTQLNTRVDLDDTELSAVESAIKQYLATCDAKIKSGERIPYAAHRWALLKLQPRLIPDIFRKTRPDNED